MEKRGVDLHIQALEYYKREVETKDHSPNFQKFKIELLQLLVMKSELVQKIPLEYPGSIRKYGFT
jgi:hypothetical protein